MTGIDTRVVATGSDRLKPCPPREQPSLLVALVGVEGNPDAQDARPLAGAKMCRDRNADKSRNVRKVHGRATTMHAADDGRYRGQYVS